MHVLILQLKNMINALHSSRDNGTKSFQHNGSTFGWKSVHKMWLRECARREKGLARMVPKLRETHIIRDAWTELNVAPAKIMQVYYPHKQLQNNILMLIFMLSKKRYCLRCTSMCMKILLLKITLAHNLRLNFLRHVTRYLSKAC